MNEFQETMVKEFQKFLNVYNNLTNSNISLDNQEYSKIIRILGNFIHKDLDLQNWQNLKLYLSKDTIIYLSIFKNTNYEDSVKNFLECLKNAFYSTIDNEIYDFIEKSAFTENEKQLCIEFYSRVKDLNNGMKNSIFDNTSNEILEKDTISTYKDKLKAFNDFVYNVSINQDLFNIIMNFDKEIKNIAKNKKHPKIFFSV